MRYVFSVPVLTAASVEFVMTNKYTMPCLPESRPHFCCCTATALIFSASGTHRKY